MVKYCILSIDGGGLRGVVPLTILKMIETKTGKRIHELFNFIAGTSTGGLITAAISIKNPLNATTPLYALDDVINVYVQRGHEIFPERTKIGNILHGGEDLFRPKFSDDGIKAVFTDVLKNYKLLDCLNDVMICSYDLNNNLPLFFKSRAAKNNPAQNALLYDACRATSAGPSYLPSYEFVYPNDAENPNRNCIDGGVYVNNPSMAALVEFSKYHGDYLPSSAADEIDYNDVFVLSLGTGSYTGKINDSDTLNKGEIYWAQQISEIMMRGVNRATDYEMKEMMNAGNYLRLSIDIDNDTHSEMTNSTSETTQYLVAATNDMLQEQDKVINDFISKMLA
ncbi:MAG: patatin-like phospholipase family protein [Parafilimonas sp.]